MAFSSLTFTTSSAQSNMGGSGSTPMSTPFRARSDLNSARKLRLINEQENLVNSFIKIIEKENKKKTLILGR
jgi:hypothetical protein